MPSMMPIVPKKSGTKKANSHGKYLTFNAPAMSIRSTTGSTEAGRRNILSGTVVTPSGIPSSVTIRIETIMLPRKLRASRKRSTTNPIINSSALGVVRSPRTSALLLLATMMPPDFKPMSAINSPMPALMDIFTLVGIALTTIRRSPIKEIRTKMMPSMKITPKATSTVMPVVSTALRMATELIPGARQNGRLVYTAMAMLQDMTSRMSAVRAAPFGRPALLSILGMVAST